MPTSHSLAARRDGDLVTCALPPPGPEETILNLLVRNAGRFGSATAFAETRGSQSHEVRWDAFLDDVIAFGTFLAAGGVREGDRVLVFSPNRAEMLVVEMATAALGGIYVPIFAGYPADQAKVLIDHARPSVIVVPGEDALARTSLPPSARTLVTFDPIEPGALARAVEGKPVQPVRFADALNGHRLGPGDPRRAAFLAAGCGRDPRRPFLMMFTSGTSGRPKGVLLTQDNILSQQRALESVWRISSQDRFLSYLPWHHSFGGLFEKYAALYHGATLWIDDSLGKDFGRLLDNWRAVQPTVYFSVPKVFQQVVGHAETHPDRVGELFHPGLRFVFTAAAALPANTSAFFAARGIPVLEGWGLTETSPCCTVTDPAEPRSLPGMVGYPIPGVEIRIAGNGEILVRGPNVMVGYFDNPEETARALPGDGWFHTGDLGEFVGHGLRLIARQDRVFKLLNAEKIVPTGIENRLAGMSPYIRHVIVTGAGRSCLTALIFPDYFRIGQEFGEDRVAADRLVKESFRDAVLAFNRDHPIKYERIQAFAVVGRELTIEAQELTPSLKVRVPTVLQDAAPYLDAMYEPSADCDCRFLRAVLRMVPDERLCFTGRDRTLDQCHECGSVVFGELLHGEFPA